MWPCAHLTINALNKPQIVLVRQRRNQQSEDVLLEPIRLLR